MFILGHKLMSKSANLLHHHTGIAFQCRLKHGLCPLLFYLLRFIFKYLPYRRRECIVKTSIKVRFLSQWNAFFKKSNYQHKIASLSVDNNHFVRCCFRLQTSRITNPLMCFVAQINFHFLAFIDINTTQDTNLTHV